MYRIMLVDDEVFIVDGLSSYLQRHMADAVEVVKAYGSEEALRHAREMRVDLVISDINMPGMDGFDLLKRFTHNWPACRFIFLTGHANFDYAYRALQHGNARFLLKSEGYARLAEVIRETLSLLEMDRQASVPAAQARQDAVFSRYAAALLRGDTSSPAPGGFRPGEPVLCVMAGLDGADAPAAGMARIEAYAQQLFQVTAHAFSWRMDEAHIAWLIQPASPVALGDEKGLRRIGRFARGMVEALQTLCLEGLEYSASFAMTDAAIPLADLPACLPVLRCLLEGRRDSEGIGSQLWVLPSGFAGVLSDAALRARMWRALRALHGEDATGLEGAAGLFAGQDLPPVRKGLAASVALYGAQAGLEGLAQDALLHLSPTDLLRLAHREMVSAARRTSGDPRERIMDAIHAYVDQNLQGQLTLTEIAGHIHMNPSYLSRYYKKLRGENLFDYIAAMRIQRAMQLLESEKMKVSDIALAVGFSSVGYFSSVFRKAVGFTPQDYRRAKRAQAEGQSR